MSVRAKDQEFDYKKNFETKRYNNVLSDTIWSTWCLRIRHGDYRIMFPVFVAPVWVSDTDLSNTSEMHSHLVLLGVCGHLMLMMTFREQLSAVLL